MNDAEKRLVFVVEDDEEVRVSTRTLLEASGYSVREFASGEDGPKHVLRPAMAISVVQLPIRIRIGVHMRLRISPRLKGRLTCRVKRTAFSSFRF